MPLLDLARELRARLEFLEEEDWSLAPDHPTEPSPAPIPAAPSTETVDERLLALSRRVDECRACPLGSSRLNPAFGVGSSRAKVLFVGEGPGFEEDRRGEPFVGKAGQLLDRILESIGLTRSTVYIANVVKCHPMTDPSRPELRGNDRPPTPAEMDACRHFLDEQIRLIRPRLIVSLGATASKALLRTESGISRLRGKWYEYADGIRLLATYHPAALLRNPELKRDVWNDMKAVRAALQEIAP